MDITNWRPITLLGIDYKLLTKTLGERLKLVLPGLVHKDQNGFVPGGNIFFSSHTIRDILFYCKKENLDLILFAIDYSKAFDTLNFKFSTLVTSLETGLRSFSMGGRAAYPTMVTFQKLLKLSVPQDRGIQFRR